MHNLLTGPGKKIFRVLWLSTASTLCALTVNAQELLVHLPLDGTVQNVGSGGAAEVMGPGPATVPGHIGSAMKFDGHSVIAVPVDLSPEQYPRVTITAWVRADETAPDTDHSVVSTGTQGTTPALRLSKRRYGVKASMRGARSALLASNYSPTEEWVFVAGTIDVPAQTLHVMQNELTYDRDGVRTSSLYPASKHVNPDDPDADPQAWVFIGARTFNTALVPAVGIAIDDVRIYGGALTTAQLADVRDAAGGQAVASAGVDLPGQPGGEFTPPDNQSPTQDILRERQGGATDIDQIEAPEDMGSGRDASISTQPTLTDDTGDRHQLPDQEEIQEQAEQVAGEAAIDGAEQRAAEREKQARQQAEQDALAEAERRAAQEEEAVDQDGDPDRPIVSPSEEILREREDGGTDDARDSAVDAALPGNQAEATIPARESPTDELLRAENDTAAEDGGIEQVDAPEGVGAGRGEPGLEPSAPDDLPGEQLQEELDAARDAASRLPPSPGNFEVYRRDAEGPVKTIRIVLPGRAALETITYQEVDGVAVAEGDIILGTVEELDEWANAIEDEGVGSGGLQTRRQGLNLRKNTKYLWPGGVIPYEFHSNMTAAARTTAANAAQTLTSMTNLSVIPRTNEDNFVEFKLKDNDLDACSSKVGRKQSRGGQTISVDPQCGEVTLIHELLHAAGFWHEQSRPDRDQFVEILLDNIIAGKRHNFERKSSDDSAGVGPYNYQSVMHYDPFSFGKDCLIIGQADPDCRSNVDRPSSSRTIRATRPGVRFQRDLSTDVDAINEIYPVRVTSDGGRNWGDTHYATAAAIGDVDGDGRGEIILGRYANDHSRFVILDDALAQHSIIATGPSNWGSGIAVTDVAVGDVDGDGVMEIGVTRHAGDDNRFYVYRLEGGNLRLLFAGGSEWGNGNYATAIAFGDADGDGRDEIAVGRMANDAGRYYLFDDEAASDSFRRLAIGGSVWGSGHYTTALAFGDVDGDGRSEIGVTRNASSGQRYEIVSLTAAGLVQRHSGGNDWGSGNFGTAIAFGNIDNDPRDEVLVGRTRSTHRPLAYCEDFR